MQTEDFINSLLMDQNSQVLLKNLIDKVCRVIYLVCNHVLLSYKQMLAIILSKCPSEDVSKGTNDSYFI